MTADSGRGAYQPKCTDSITHIDALLPLHGDANYRKRTRYIPYHQAKLIVHVNENASPENIELIKAVLKEMHAKNIDYVIDESKHPQPKIGIVFVGGTDINDRSQKLVKALIENGLLEQSELETAKQQLVIKDIRRQRPTNTATNTDIKKGEQRDQSR